MDGFRRPVDQNSHPTLGWVPKSLRNGFSCLVSHLSPFRLRTKPSVMSWSNVTWQIDLDLHLINAFMKQVPRLHVCQNFVTEGTELRKRNKQRFNKNPNKPLVSWEDTEMVKAKKTNHPIYHRWRLKNHSNYVMICLKQYKPTVGLLWLIIPSCASEPASCANNHPTHILWKITNVFNFFVCF